MTRTSKFILWLLCGLALLVISFIVWRVNLAHDVDAKLQAIRAAGLPTNGKELNAYYPAVPDNENAALVMIQAFELMRNYPDDRSNEVASFNIPPRGQSLSTEQKKLLSDYVEMNTDALAKASEAIKLSQSRYPIDFSAGVETEFPHLMPLKNLVKAAEFKALLELESGHLTNADIAIKNILGIANTLDNEPEMMSWLVRNTSIGRATTMLERRLNADVLTDQELNEFSAGLASVEGTNLLKRAVIALRANRIPYFRMTWSQLRQINEANGDSTDGMPDSERQPFLFWVSGWHDCDLRFFLKIMNTNVAVTGLPPPQNIIAYRNFDFEKIAKTIKRYHFNLSAMFLPELSSSVRVENKGFAQIRSATAALAVEHFRLAHGQLPENMNELVPQFLPTVPSDPFDGAPLRYHRLAKGYVIYSVGRDGHDDGGREKPADWKSSDKTTYDITFTVER
jgi:hypothetical protein